tara:strand:- start:765 stop:1076 length:312 start_codon:yes stop_codon:yes gene_type:complete
MNIQEILLHLEITGEALLRLDPAPKVSTPHHVRCASPLRLEEFRALLERASDLIKAQTGEIASLNRSIKERDDLFDQLAGALHQQRDLEEAARALGVSNQLGD